VVERRSSAMASTKPLALALWVAACHGSSGAPSPDGGHKVHDAAMALDAPETLDAVRPGDVATPPATLVDVLTQHNDNARTGVNPHETRLTADNVSPTTFGKLMTLPVDGLIYAQPLIVSSLSVGGQTRNVLFTATSHDSAFAFDADTGAQLWKTSLGTPVPSAQVGPTPDAALGTLNIPNEVGVVSTPVIDRAGGVMYVTSTNYHGAGVAQTMALHVLSLTTGAEVAGSPVQIAASIPGTGDGTSTIELAANAQTQRPGLLLLNGTVYLGFASHEDYSPFHGFILGYTYDKAAGTLTQTQAFTTTADGQGGGIWAGGQGLVADDAGAIYAMVANGTTNVQDGGHSYGESFLKLSPQLSVLDWFVVSGYEGFNVADWDLGSGGPTLLPGTPFIAGGGKQGRLYVVNRGHLGGLNADTTGGVQSFQATATEFEGLFGGPVVWTGQGATRFYIWGVQDSLKEYQLVDGGMDPTPIATTPFTTPEIAGPGAGDPVGALSISANGESGILWGSIPLANPVHAVVDGELYALDAVTLDVLWTSEQNDARDKVGNHAKFVPPTIANGKVYLATMSNALVVYGLLGAEDGGA
jgi:outer membrane protein assembly factor BamB